MQFSVLDKQTLQCVMTKAEAADYGMDRKAIYKNDKRAEDFFRKIMRRAQKETGFIKRQGHIAVHAAFLSDESLEITFSVGKKEPLLDESEAGPYAAAVSAAVFKSRELDHMIRFSRNLPGELETCLYKYRDVYFMMADIRDYGVYETAVLICLADEYMEEICYTNSIAAFLKEHGECIIEKNAAERLGKL